MMMKPPSEILNSNMRVLILGCLFCLAHVKVISRHKTGEEVIDSLLMGLKESTSDNRSARLCMAISTGEVGRNPSSALSFARKGLDFAAREGDPGLLMDAHQQMGRVLFYNYRYDSSIHHFEQAMKEGRRSGNRAGIIYARLSLSLVRLALEDYRKSIAGLQQARSDLANLHGGLFSEIPLKERLTIQLNLGICQQALGELQEARQVLDSGIAAARASGDHWSILGKMLVTKAKVMIGADSVSAAKAMLEQADSIFAHWNAPALSVLVEWARMDLAAKKGDRAMISSRGRKLIARTESLGNIGLKKSTAETLYRFYRDIGVADSAILYKEMAEDCKQSLKLEDTKSLLTRKELMDEFEDKMGALQEQAESVRILRYAYLGGSALLLLALLAVYRKYHARLKVAGIEHERIEVENRSLLEQSNGFRDVLNQREMQIKDLKSLETNDNLMESLRKLKESRRPAKASPDSEVEAASPVIQARRARSNDAWDEFELRFGQMNSGYYERLRKRFPDLTLNERRLCAFLSLDMTTKEITNITGQSIRAVNIARTRIRKKNWLFSDLSG